jgi:hypothetical protein
MRKSVRPCDRKKTCRTGVIRYLGLVQTDAFDVDLIVIQIRTRILGGVATDGQGPDSDSLGHLTGLSVDVTGNVSVDADQQIGSRVLHGAQHLSVIVIDDIGDVSLSNLLRLGIHGVEHRGLSVGGCHRVVVVQTIGANSSLSLDGVVDIFAPDGSEHDKARKIRFCPSGFRARTSAQVI